MAIFKTIITAFFGLWLVGYGLSFSILAQDRVGEIDRIEKPPDGATDYGRQPVRSVEVYRQSGQIDFGYRALPLNVNDVINVERGDPKVYRLVLTFDDPTRPQAKLAPGANVRLVGREEVRAQGGLRSWIVGKIRATTQYFQAIAPGTQYGLEVVGERSRVFVWEGEVQVTNLGPNPQTVSVREKQLTEAVGPSQPSPPRVPSFDEVKDLVLFGLDLDPVIRGTVTDESLRQRLHEDFIRAQFESRVQRTAVGPQINLANVYLFLHKDDEALKAFEEAERISPRPAAIYNGRGVALTRLGQYEAAAEAFNQAISRDNESIFYNNLGNLYLLRGGADSVEQALVKYEQASKRDRTNAAPYNGRGVALLQQKELPAAEVALNTSIRLKDRAVPHSNLGNLYLLQNNLTVAEAEYNTAIQLDPREAAAWNNRGVYHLKQRQYQQAKEDFDRAIQADPRDPSPLVGLGLAYTGLKQFEEAVSALVTALTRAPTRRGIYRNLAFLFLTEVSVRASVESQLQEAAAARADLQPAFARFLEFLRTLPTVSRENFDAAFEQFRLSAGAGR